jgi:hypothetical protein
VEKHRAKKVAFRVKWRSNIGVRVRIDSRDECWNTGGRRGFGGAEIAGFLVLVSKGSGDAFG